MVLPAQLLRAGPPEQVKAQVEPAVEWVVPQVQSVPTGLPKDELLVVE